MTGRITKASAFASLPRPWPEDLRPRIRAAVAAQPQHKVVVIDDDPTGTQTVYDVPVLTGWEVENLREEFSRAEPCFYILTNSRSLPPEEARSLALEVGTNLGTAADGRSFTVVSRSDSTLRGHFPTETDALGEVLGPFDATLLIPYFEDGGRYTIDDVHYLAEGDDLIPTADTPFARDAAFGYRSSHLPTYVEEKSAGRIKAGEVQSIGLTELRHGGPDAVTARLLKLSRGSLAVINAAGATDLDVFVTGLLAAEAQGRRFCFRTAAQFPAARLGLEPRPLRTTWTLGLATMGDREIELPENPDATVSGSEAPKRNWKSNCSFSPENQSGGLTMVGSYVPATTRQLARLSEVEGLLQIELRVDQVLSARRHQTLADVSRIVATALSAGQDVVVFTSRGQVNADSPAASLQIGRRISEALVELLRSLEVRPKYVIAKGGITSSDLATHALGVKRAMVLGQVIPGVPVWRLGPESKFPGLIYIVFPGNVGEAKALADVIEGFSS